MIGFLFGIWKNLEYLGWSLVEAFVFMLAFNYMAPRIDTLVSIPVTEVKYLEAFCIFILVHYIGKWIKSLSPFRIDVKQTNTNHGKEKS